MVFTQLCSTSHLASDGMDFKTMHAFAFHMCHLVLSFSSPAAQYVGLEIWVRMFSVGTCIEKKLTNMAIRLHKNFFCFLFNCKCIRERPLMTSDFWVGRQVWHHRTKIGHGRLVGLQGWDVRFFQRQIKRKSFQNL